MPGLNCREYEIDLMDLARRRPLQAATRASLAAHLENCVRCRHVLHSQLRLSAAAGVVAHEASAWSAPLRVELAVMAGMGTVRAPGRRRRYVFALAGAAIAASLAITIWTRQPGIPKPPVAVAAPIIPVAAEPIAMVTKRAAGPHRRRVSKPALAQQPFIAIPYTLPLAPYERADVMRMDVPVAALIAVGLPMSMADPSAMARADVLVGQDGRARAIRLVTSSMASADFQQTGVNEQ